LRLDGVVISIQSKSRMVQGLCLQRTYQYKTQLQT
jgi:hypothetical protein